MVRHRAAALLCVSTVFFLLLDSGTHGSSVKYQLLPSRTFVPPGPPATNPTKEESEALRRILPQVTFDCKGKTGYFPDSKFNCEVFHYCKPDGTRNTFHCATNAIFNQLSMVCEEKSGLNIRLCKEGSIVSKKPDRNDPSKTTSGVQAQSNPQTISSSHKPSLKDEEKNKTNVMITLEDLLSYMNSERNQQDQNKMPNFISTFHKATSNQTSKAVVNIKNPLLITTQTSVTVDRASPMPKESTVAVDQKVTTIQKDEVSEDITVAPTEMVGESSEQVVVIDKRLNGSLNESDPSEEVSAEFEAIEGRKRLKFGKKTRNNTSTTTKLPDNKWVPSTHAPHSHVSARSPTPRNSEDDADSSTESADGKTNSGPPSLFSTDRNAARKRKRFQNRRRKPEKTSESDVTAPTEPTISDVTVRKDDRSSTRLPDSRRRKPHRTRVEPKEKDSPKMHTGFTKMEKVEPYTLPPLPYPDDTKMETVTKTTTEHSPTSPESSTKKDSHKNPFYKKKVEAEDSARFGEKITSSEDQHHHASESGGKYHGSSVDYFGEKDVSVGSDEHLVAEHRDYPKPKGDTEKRRRKNKHRPPKKVADDSTWTADSQEEDRHKFHDIFPPPRSLNEKSQKSHKYKTFDSSVEIRETTESPVRVTQPYRDHHHHTKVKDFDPTQWSFPDESDTYQEKKVKVGSTFPKQLTTTSRPWLIVPPTTEPPVTNSIFTKEEQSKYHSAHESLSKLMNDFFGMSSQNMAESSHVGKPEKDNQFVMPDYRIPGEDMYEDSDSAGDELEELPEELLEVVDFLAEQAGLEKKDPKSHANHEVIQINGPILDSHLEKIFSDEKGEDKHKGHKDDSNANNAVKASTNKLVMRPHQKDHFSDTSASEESNYDVRLEPLIKHIMAEDKARKLRIVPVKIEAIKDHPTATIAPKVPKIISAKKVPIRVIYRDQLRDIQKLKTVAGKPNFKVVRSSIPRPNLQLIHSGKLTVPHQQSPLIVHPPSLYPPHPPPLHRKPYPPRSSYPFPSSIRSLINSLKYKPRRRKRSIVSRLRRQIGPSGNFNPFVNPFYPSFNNKFATTFPPFKNIFGNNMLNAAGTNLSPFSFPGMGIQKPPLSRPLPSDPHRPPSVHHITQNGQQTIIVEEVPIPIHVEVPDPNLPNLRPLHPVPSLPKPPPRYPNPQFQQPQNQRPLLLRPPLTYPPLQMNKPISMPSNVRPPSVNYGPPSMQYPSPLPNAIVDKPFPFFMGVTNKPFDPPPLQQVRNTGPLHNSNQKPQKFNQVRYYPFDGMGNSYPTLPYYQAVFTTPMIEDPVPGRLMYSGYKPPKTTPSTKPRGKKPHSGNDRKVNKASSYRPRPDGHIQTPLNPSYVGYEGAGRVKDNYYVNPSTQSFYNSVTDAFTMASPPRKRRPGKRRRPKPRPSTPSMISLTDTSPTPSPPEQIPSPPSDYTSIPFYKSSSNSLQSLKDSTEGSSAFPQAGYYGKDQLGQFFDSSSKSYKKASTLSPHQQRELGEGISSAETEESLSSYSSSEDSEQPAFGTRLRSNSGSKPKMNSRNKIPTSSQSQQTEIRSRPKLEETRTPERPPQRIPENRNRRPPPSGMPRRRRPQGQRPRPNRPPVVHGIQPEVQYFNPNEMSGGFFSVPSGIQGFVPHAERPKQFGGPTDMFGMPHPVIDPNIYSFRPQGAPIDFGNFFSVPPQVAKEQQSSLHSMNLNPINGPSRNFFNAPGVKAMTSEGPPKSESNSENKSSDVNQPRKPVIRKVRKQKRKNRYPNNEETKPVNESEMKQPRLRESTVRYRERTTTAPTTTTPEPTSYTPTSTGAQNDIQESPVFFKSRQHLLPKTLPDISNSLNNGKIDLNKLNASISTSVSVSNGQTNATTEEGSQKKVFSSKNGGLAVVRKGPKRKRVRQRVSTSTFSPYGSDNESSTDSKYDIAASVQDIIKATSETERQTSTFVPSEKGEVASSSNQEKTWILNPPGDFQSKKIIS